MARGAALSAQAVDRPDDTHLPSTAVRVLLVEDDEGDAFLVRELLLDAGSEVILSRARTLAEATLALPGEVDCVLLDLGLPDSDGLEALRAVLEVAPSIAVLVLTGLADEHRGTEAVAAGAQDYLVKGAIDGQLLTRAIRYAVERKRADESVRRLYASEVRAAENARLERGLLPQPLVRDLGVEVHRLYRPGRHQSLLGGDFYDVVECADGAVFALIGDVAGHGPDEAAIGVCLRIAWRTLVLSGADPDTIFASMHTVLVSERESDEVFATVAMVRVDADRTRARFWLAGHPVPLLVEERAARRGPDECHRARPRGARRRGVGQRRVSGDPGPHPAALHRRHDRGLQRPGPRPPPGRGGDDRAPRSSPRRTAWPARSWPTRCCARSRSATAAT